MEDTSSSQYVITFLIRMGRSDYLVLFSVVMTLLHRAGQIILEQLEGHHPTQVLVNVDIIALGLEEAIMSLALTYQ